MTHAHNNTLLSRLGFSDPDRRSGEHDLICQYIAAHAEDFAGRILPPIQPRSAAATKEVPVQSVSSSALLEVRLCSERNFTIGFADIVVSNDRVFRSIVLHDDGNDCRFANRSSWGQHCCIEQEIRRVRIGVEVKVAYPGVGEVARQIELYKAAQLALEERPRWCAYWVLATPVRLSAADVETLNAKDIRYVRIGQRFHAWKATQANREPSKVEEF